MLEYCFLNNFVRRERLSFRGRSDWDSSSWYFICKTSANGCEITVEHGCIEAGVVCSTPSTTIDCGLEDYAKTPHSLPARSSQNPLLPPESSHSNTWILLPWLGDWANFLASYSKPSEKQNWFSQLYDGENHDLSSPRWFYHSNTATEHLVFFTFL